MITPSADVKPGTYAWTVDQSLAAGNNYVLELSQGDTVNYSPLIAINGTNGRTFSKGADGIAEDNFSVTATAPASVATTGSASSVSEEAQGSIIPTSVATNTIPNQTPTQLRPLTTMMTEVVGTSSLVSPFQISSIVSSSFKSPTTLSPAFASSTTSVKPASPEGDAQQRSNFQRSLGVILGVSIPLILATLVIFFIIWRRRKHARTINLKKGDPFPKGFEKASIRKLSLVEHHPALQGRYRSDSFAEDASVLSMSDYSDDEGVVEVIDDGKHDAAVKTAGLGIVVHTRSITRTSTNGSGTTTLYGTGGTGTPPRSPAGPPPAFALPPPPPSAAGNAKMKKIPPVRPPRSPLYPTNEGNSIPDIPQNAYPQQPQPIPTTPTTPVAPIPTPTVGATVSAVQEWETEHGWYGRSSTMSNMSGTKRGSNRTSILFDQKNDSSDMRDSIPLIQSIKSILTGNNIKKSIKTNSEGKIEKWRMNVATQDPTNSQPPIQLEPEPEPGQWLQAGQQSQEKPKKKGLPQPQPQPLVHPYYLQQRFSFEQQSRTSLEQVRHSLEQQQAFTMHALHQQQVQQQQLLEEQQRWFERQSWEREQRQKRIDEQQRLEEELNWDKQQAQGSLKKKLRLSPVFEFLE